MKTLLSLLHAETFDEIAKDTRDLFALKTLNNDLFGYAYYKDTYRFTENRVESVVLRRLGFEAGVCGSHPFDPDKMKRLRDDPRTHAPVREEVIQQLQMLDGILGIGHFSDAGQRDALREYLLNARKKHIEKDILSASCMWSLNTEDINERVDAFLKCSVKHAFAVQNVTRRRSYAA